AACINMDASDGLDNTDAISKTQNTDSTAAQTGDQGQMHLNMVTKPNAAHCKMDTFEAKAKMETAPLLKCHPMLRLPKTQTAAVRSKKTLLKTGSDQPYAAALDTAFRRLTSSRHHIHWPTARPLSRRRLCVSRGPLHATNLLHQQLPKKRLDRSIRPLHTRLHPEIITAVLRRIR
ncbi:hypothetical protein M9458_035407, partial [Cirrhinus mrigala]